MVDAFAADLASGLLCKILSLVAEELIQAWGLEKNLQALRKRLELVDKLLSDADSKPVTVEAVQVWLKELKDVARVADALMEQLNYEVLRIKVEGRKVRDFFSPSKNSILYRLEMSHKIKHINISLDKIYKEAGDIGLRAVEHLNTPAQRNEIRHSPPFINEMQIVGRDDDISKVVKRLCENNENDLSVIAVVGMGGMGKTTLARSVYRSDEVMSFFQKKIWVTVSDDFDVTRVLNEMIQSLTGTNPKLSNLEATVKELQESIKGGTFLLVLDDVWNKNSENWESMSRCLVGVGGAKGSKIMLTTREDEVVSTMKSNSPTYQVSAHTLLGLSADDSWQLFKQITFREDGAVENDNLEAMGRRMVARCGGLPLAIKALGALLYSKKSEQDWLRIEESETWALKSVLPSLKLTYNNLPSLSLKHCFAYCATFPKDFYIEKDKLIQIWMALGLLPPRGSDLSMEDVGNEYFSTLLGNYLLQDVEKDEYDNITGCKMHDLVHDLALDASRNYCKTLDVGEANHVSEAVHVWLNATKDKEPKILKGRFERVQTLHLSGGILGNMIPNLTHVTVLVLANHRIEELPRSIGQLKYMRYLDIEHTRIKELPDSITKLYNLQTLRCSDLRKLPQKLGNLINMRHMYLSSDGTPNMDHTFIGIERLTCLQTLTYFVVGRNKELHLENLGGLTNLKGGLSIYGLEEVTNMGDASKANLSKKSKIQCLEFRWKDVDHDNFPMADDEYNDEDVLEGLEPPAYLKELKIGNFKGKKLSSWMISESRSSVVLQNLVYIRLEDCYRCEGIPPLGHLPNLKVISVNNMRNVKRIGEEFYGGHGDAKTISIMFPSLRTLELYGMPKLEEWMEAVTVHDPLPSTHLFPCLEELCISRCDNLMILPSHFPSLKILRLWRINSVALEKICTKLNCLTSLTLESIKGGSIEFNLSIVNEFLGNNKSLRRLSLLWWDALPGFLAIENQQEVSSCPNPSSISAPVSTSLIRLEELSIGPFLEDLDHFPWPIYSFSFVSSLNYLYLIGWAKLKSLPEQLQHLSSLTQLTLAKFDGLEALPDWLGNLSSLQFLCLWNCRNLVRMPTLEAMKSLRNLKSLWIWNCKFLSERCAKESGPEWYKIAHIPHISHFPIKY